MSLHVESEAAPRSEWWDQAQPNDRTSTQWTVSWALAALGIFLRVRQYAFHRSLWNDEAALSINIINRGFGELTRKLAVEQGAPIGFLWLEKAATELFGNSEYALRLVPLLAGVASVLLFQRLSTRILPAMASHVALGLFAIAPALVYYASEAKQYGFDVFAAVALASFLPWLLEVPLSRRKILWWAGAAGLLIWCSFPATFVVGAVSIVVVIHQASRRCWTDVLHFLAGSAIWLASLAVEYVVSLRSLHADPKLLGFWEFAFPPRPLGVSTTATWFRQDLRAIVAFPWDLRVYPFAAVLVLAGLVALLWRRPFIGLFATSLGGAVAVAAIFHEYPMADRMVLFTVPIMCLLLGSVVLLAPTPPMRVLLVGLVLVVSANEIGVAASAVVHPYTKTELRESYEFVLHHQRPGDAVLIEWEGIPDFLYYHETLGVAGDGDFRLSGSQSSCNNAQQLDRLVKWKRVWLVLGIDPGSEQGRPIAHYEEAFRGIGTVALSYHAPGPSAAVLLKIDPRGDIAQGPIAAPPWQPGPYGCISVQLAPLAEQLTQLNQG
jgi:hypothetical protein